MHRDKDICLGEDGYTNRFGHAPRNIFTQSGAVRTLLRQIHTSPTKATEIIQDSRSKAVRLIAGRKETRVFWIVLRNTYKGLLFTNSTLK